MASNSDSALSTSAGDDSSGSGDDTLAVHTAAIARSFMIGKLILLPKLKLKVSAAGCCLLREG